MYSKKSAYRLLAKSVSNNQPGPSCPTKHKDLWNSIWRLNIPNKIKHFLWRTCSKSLPTKRNLTHRKITTDASCDLCRDHHENAIHVLWDCYVVKEIWWHEELCKPHLWDRFVNFQELFLGFLKVKDPLFAERAAYISWSIWFKRNAVRTGSPSLPHSMIHANTIERLQEFQQVQDRISTPLQSQMTVHWSPPPISWCKANFDGAIFQELGAAGLGVVIRDHEGSVIGALFERIALPPSVEDVEALAGRRAIAFAKEIGLQEVIFEGDAEIIINSLFTDGECMAHFGHLIKDSRQLAASLRAFTFSHVKEKGNSVADKLAKLARESPFPRIWFNDIHSDATNLVLLDRSFC